MVIRLKNALYIIRHDGIWAFLVQVRRFLTQSLFFDRTFYIYAGRLSEMTRKAVRPEIEGLSIRIVKSNREAGELSAEGYVLKPWRPEYRYRLDNGATAFCVFAGRQLIHVSWHATTAEAMRSLGDPPYKVDFANKEVVLGDYWTHPDYRGKGIAHYTTRERMQYLWENGVVLTRGVVLTDNRASLRSMRPGDERFQVNAIGRHRKILWWQSWKETPLKPQ